MPQMLIVIMMAPSAVSWLMSRHGGAIRIFESYRFLPAGQYLSTHHLPVRKKGAVGDEEKVGQAVNVIKNPWNACPGHKIRH